MAVKNTAQVVIGGKIITLGGYESEEYFQKVASYINNKIAELSEMPGYSRQPMETKHTLLSLNITDDYFKAKKQAEIFEQDLQQKDQEMYELKHELIALRMKMEETEKHQQESAAPEQPDLEGKSQRTGTVKLTNYSNVKVRKGIASVVLFVCFQGYS
ncbi:MAG: cell division protein ZapA [Blautia caecimuris]